jgi:catechol 2,3-dioxygenase-like lactoylglutathione lyase family enzyme
MVPFRVKGLDHVVLRVADLPRALAFYREVLGAALERDTPQIGLTQLRIGASLIDLVNLAGPLGRLGGAGPGAEGRNMDHFAVQVTPFDEAEIRAHLDAHSVKVTSSGQRYGAEGEGPSIYIEDPDGNTVELKGPPS